MSDGHYYSSKKTDDICEDVCGQVRPLIPNLCSVSVLINFVMNRFFVCFFVFLWH